MGDATYACFFLIESRGFAVVGRKVVCWQGREGFFNGWVPERGLERFSQAGCDGWSREIG